MPSPTVAARRTDRQPLIEGCCLRAPAVAVQPGREPRGGVALPVDGGYSRALKWGVRDVAGSAIARSAGHGGFVGGFELRHAGTRPDSSTKRWITPAGGAGALRANGAADRLRLRQRAAERQGRKAVLSALRAFAGEAVMSCSFGKLGRWTRVKRAWYRRGRQQAMDQP